MNDEYNKNGTLTGPLIFTLPTSSFVVVLSLNWLDGTDRAVASAKTHGSDYLVTGPRTAKKFGERALSLVKDLRRELLTRLYRI
jgi:hypothetical protein